MTRAMLDKALSILASTGMIRRLDDTELAYMIKHALVQDTAQSTLLKNENRVLHLMVAMALEQVNAGRLDEYAAELAFHYALGEDDAKTFEYSLRAGDVASRVFANAEALAHYHRAIEIARRGSAPAEQLIELYTRHGRILEIIGEYQQALTSYEQLQELALERQDRSLELASLMLRAPVYSVPLPTFDAPLAKQLLLDALGMARELENETAEARVLWNLTLLSVQTMRPADGLMYGELALAICEKLNLREQQAYTLHDLFLPYRATGQIAQARAVQKRARELFRETNNQSMLTDNLGMSAQASMFEGALNDAVEFATEGIAISRMIDNPFGEIFNSLFLSIVHQEQGEHELVLQEIQERNPVFAQSNPPIHTGWLATMHCWLLALLGAWDESDKMERIARSTSNLAMPPIFRSGQIGMLARTRLLRGDTEGAVADLAQWNDDVSTGNLLHPGLFHMPFAHAELALQQQEYSRAVQDLVEQEQFVTVNQVFLVLTENLLLQARAQLGLDNSTQALALLERALALVETIGSRRLEYQILDALSEAEYRLGQTAQAERHCARARAVLEYMLAHTPAEYRAGFIRLTSVQRVLVKE